MVWNQTRIRQLPHPIYRGPDLVSASPATKPRADYAVTLWAIGIMCLQVYVPRLFAEMTDDAVLRCVGDQSFNPPFHLVDDVQIRGLLPLLLHRDPMLRSLPSRVIALS